MNGINRFIFKATFSAADRRDVYEGFLSYLIDSFSADEIFDKLILAYTRRGKKPNHPIAQILAECKANLPAGTKVSSSFNNWFPEEEVSILHSAEEAGNLNKGFHNAIFLSEGMVRISDAFKALRNTVAYMSLLTFGLIVMFCMTLVPAIQQFVPINQWGGLELSLWYIYIAVSKYWYVIIAFIILSVYILWRSFSRWTGSLRNKMDNHFPYSVYKRIMGSIFIMNMSAMLTAGIPMEDAIDRLMEQCTSPWLLERLEATKMAIKAGEKNLGNALDTTGYDFPGIEAIIKMQSLFDTRNGIQAIERFSAEWLNKTVISLEKLSTTVRVVSMFICGGSIIYLVTVMSTLLQEINQF